MTVTGPIEPVRERLESVTNSTVRDRFLQSKREYNQIPVSKPKMNPPIEAKTLHQV